MNLRIMGLQSTAFDQTWLQGLRVNVPEASFRVALDPFKGVPPDFGPSGTRSNLPCVLYGQLFFLIV